MNINLLYALYIYIYIWFAVSLNFSFSFVYQTNFSKIWQMGEKYICFEQKENIHISYGSQKRSMCQKSRYRRANTLTIEILSFSKWSMTVTISWIFLPHNMYNVCPLFLYIISLSYSPFISMTDHFLFFVYVCGKG